MDLHETMDVSCGHCGDHFTIHTHQTIKLYPLSLFSAVCQLLLNKTGGEKKEDHLEFIFGYPVGNMAQ